MFCYIGELNISDDDSMLTFAAGTTVLTQCISVELLLDANSELPSLMIDILAANASFLGESLLLTLGQVFTVDVAGRTSAH